MSVNYSKACPTLNAQCEQTFTIDKDMKGPIYVYYEMDGYF